MSLFKAVLLLHITLGVMAMIAGPISMFSRKRRGVHTVAGNDFKIVLTDGLVIKVDLTVTVTTTDKIILDANDEAPLAPAPNRAPPMPT